MIYLRCYVYQLADMLLEIRKTVRARGVRLVSIRCEYGLWIGNVVLAMNFASAFGGVECVYTRSFFSLFLAVRRSVGFSGGRKQISLIQIPKHYMITFQARTLIFIFILIFKVYHIVTCIFHHFPMVAKLQTRVHMTQTSD
jgi:hypothetical protein